MKTREPKPDISTALTVEHFCQMFGVSEPLYRALRRNHLGPRDVRVGDVRFNAHYGLKSDIAACPKSAAGSTGRRNTGVKSLGWGFECHGLTWPFV